MPVRPDKEVIDILRFRGAKALTTTIKNTAIADNGDGTVRLETTATHGFTATLANPIHMEIEGTTNYDGVRKIVNISDTTHFDIVAKYVAETPAGTETAKFNIYQPSRPWEFVNIEVAIDTAPTTAGNLTIDLDAAYGSTWDTNILTENMVGVVDFSWRIPHGERTARVAGDRIRFAYANADTRNIAITVQWGILS